MTFVITMMQLSTAGLLSGLQLWSRGSHQAQRNLEIDNIIPTCSSKSQSTAVENYQNTP